MPSGAGHAVKRGGLCPETGAARGKEGPYMEAYFDNSATTRVLEPVKDIVVKIMTEDYGNPSAKHKKGMEAERYIKEAAEIIAGTLKVAPKEIVFTSGGSESNNMALIETAMANKRAGNHIISTGIEHASVYNSLAFLEEQGFSVTYLPVDAHGHIRLEELEAAIRPETILVSIMYVNNEIGAVEPIEAISKAIKKKNPSILFHVDAIQAYGKFVIRPKRQGIDLLSVSAHKIHGPKGVGFLYIDQRVKIRPLIYGGGQQRGMRSGTENVPGVAGMGVAAKIMYTDHGEKMKSMIALKDYMIDRFSEIDGVTVNSLPGDLSAPQIVSASFLGIRSEVLLHALEERDIYVSSGSACSSNHPAVSGTLKGIGVKPELLDSTLRFSFGVYNTKEEIDYCIDVLKELMPVLRRYQRG
jgi:cysteine desulfurase